MSLNLGYYIFFVVIIVFTIIYTTSNGSISSNQEILPIVYAQSLPLPLPTLYSDQIETQQQKVSSDQIETQQQNEETVIATGFWSGSQSLTQYGFFYDYFFTKDNSFSGPVNTVVDINGNHKYRATGSWSVSCNVVTIIEGVATPFSFTGIVDSSKIAMFSTLSLGVYFFDNEACSVIMSTLAPPGSVTGEFGYNYDFGTVSYSISQDPAFCRGTFYGCLIDTMNSNWDVDPVNVNPPNARIEVFPSKTVESDTRVTLDGTESYDPDIGDSIASYKWEQIEGHNINLSAPSSSLTRFIAPHNITENTILTFRLTVTDTFGASGSTETSITVKPLNRLPDPVIVVTPQGNVQPGTIVTIDASGSTDPDGDELSFHWGEIENSPNDPSISLIPLNAKSSIVQFQAPSVTKITTLNFALGIRDSSTDVVLTSVSVIVIPIPINNPPNAIIDVSPSNTVESDTRVTLDGSRSNDPDVGDEIMSYKWEQIEGPPVDLMPPISSSQIGLSSPKVTFVPELSTETNLVFELEVTDKFGASGFVLGTITVKPKGIPTANAGSDLEENERKNIFSRTTVQLDGSGFDPNGDALTYSWRPLTTGAPPLNDPTLPNPTFKVPNISEDTLYEYQLTVNDGKNTSIPDKVRVNVTATKINMILDTEEITPEIGRIGFASNLVVQVAGFAPPSSDRLIQPGIPGGEVVINLQIKGITNPSNIPVSLEFEPLEDTGGHDHLNTITQQSKRAFGGFVKGAALITDLNGKFDNNGIFIATFRANNLLSQYSSAAGFIDIKASILLLTFPLNESVEEATVTDRVTIRIAGLSPLLEGNNYNLVGKTPEHPDNHYGNPVINFELNEIANDYVSLHPGDLLQYNDESLAFGGVFDISGDWTPEGRDGHKSHACGTDIDIDDKSARGTNINPIDLAKIIMTKYPGAFMINEGNHFHAHFEHCR